MGSTRRAGRIIVALLAIIPLAMVLAGLPSWYAVAIGAPGVALWFPFDRFILAAAEARPRTDQDRT